MYYLEKDSNMTFDLNYDVEPYIKALFPYTDKDGHQYISFQNGFKNQIVFYDIQTKEMAFKIDLDIEGDNGVGFFLGYYIDSLDSIYLTSLQLPEIYSVNKEGKINKKIYYGKSKSDPTVRYRFTQKFGDDDSTNKEVFANVKDALLDLIQSGKELDFRAIDENPLSQMFKAKILSLYFPEHFINICSKDHLKEIAMEMGIKEQQFISKYQHLLFKKKLEHKITRNWSNPKYMSFLYAQFIRKDLSSTPAVIVKKPQKRNHPEVNFEEITDNRDLIGKKSEEYALNWEKNRLIGLGYSKLAEEIDDRRNRPTYGYDFLSFNAPGDERYIEVKSIGRDGKEGAFRFFLSGNELTVSNLSNHRKNYYFYLVQYGKDGEPCNLYVKHAQDLYTKSEMSPCAYVVRFDLEAVSYTHLTLPTT